jgi:hypothetical protein
LVGEEWWTKVREEHRKQAEILEKEVDWSWATNPQISDNIHPIHLTQYKLFLICKRLANDVVIPSDRSRSVLSPTYEINEVWRQHVMRPSQYLKMCSVLLRGYHVIGTTTTTSSEVNVLEYIPESENDAQEVKEKRVQRMMQYLCFLLEDASRLLTERLFFPESVASPTSLASAKKIPSLGMNDPVDGNQQNLPIPFSVKVLNISPSSESSNSKSTSTGLKSNTYKVYSSATTVYGLKTMIYDREDIPPCHQYLVFYEKGLVEDRKTLSDCNIQEGSVVILRRIDMDIMKANMILLVKTHTGRTITLSHVNWSMTILKIKELIQQKEAVNFKQQSLILAGLELENNRTLQECNIFHQQILHLLVKDK